MLFKKTAVCGMHTRFNAESPEDVKRKITYVEDYDEDHSEPASLLFGTVTGIWSTAQTANNPCVAQRDYKQGQQEAKRRQEPVVPPESIQFFGAGKIQAGNNAVRFPGSKHSPHRYDFQQRNSPHRSTGNFSPSFSVDGREVHWVNNDKEPEDAETSQEEDTAIQVQVERQPHKVAQGIVKCSTVSHDIVVHQEREAYQVQEVGDGQVQHDDDAASPWPHLARVDEDCNDVSREAHNEDDAVHGGKIVFFHYVVLLYGCAVPIVFSTVM